MDLLGSFVPVRSVDGCTYESIEKLNGSIKRSCFGGMEEVEVFAKSCTENVQQDRKCSIKTLFGQKIFICKIERHLRLTGATMRTVRARCSLSAQLQTEMYFFDAILFTKAKVKGK